MRRYRKRVIVTELNKILQLLPMLIVPSLILFNNPLAFLSTITFFFVYRSFWYFKNLRRINEPLNEKIFASLMILIWIVLQISYSALWILQQINQNEDSDKINPQNKYFCIKIIGFVIIFTVLVGGVIEIVRFVIELIHTGLSIFRILARRMKNKIAPVL